MAIRYGVPGIEADAVGDTILEVGSYPTARRSAVRRDVEGRESLVIGLGED